MVASGAEASPKVPLLAKFAKSRAPITNSVRNWQSTPGGNEHDNEKRLKFILSWLKNHSPLFSANQIQRQSHDWLTMTVSHAFCRAFISVS